jgi:membrane-associated phospholipid phosphatase
MKRPSQLAAISILVLGLCLFVVVGQIEAPIVLSLWQSPLPVFRDFMADSVYEGDFIGGSDLGVTAAIICFFVWLRRRKKPHIKTRFSNDELKFIWLSSLMSAIVVVHSLKWIVGRLRPHVFFGNANGQITTPEHISDLVLPGFLPFLGPRGIGLNSFPSGHTASCAILLTFSYVLWQRHKSMGLALGVCVLTYALAMAAARSMSGMHWLSDSIASIFLTWSLIHYNFYRIIKK